VPGVKSTTEKKQIINKPSSLGIVKVPHGIPAALRPITAAKKKSGFHPV
jgi:hypothetical protein